MLEILSGFPDGVLAVKASGRVTKADYEAVLIPAVKAGFAKHQKLRCYYEIGPECSGFDAGAMWKDFTVGVEFWTRWQRVAVVTGVDWIKHTVHAFSFFMPCLVKVFAPGEAAQARIWISS